MPSRHIKAKTKLQGAYSISLLKKPDGKRDLFKVILAKARKTHTPPMIFRLFSLLCGAFSINIPFKFNAGKS